MCYWIDTHTHLDIIEKDPCNQQQVIDQALTKNIKVMITISTGLDSYFKGKNLSLTNPGIVFTTCGLYPVYTETYNDELKQKLVEQLNEGIAVALGEIGLDYHWQYGTPEQQKTLFRDQLRLAKDYNLPVIIHARDSLDDVYSMLAAESPLPGGVMHCFSGDEDYAEKFMDLGFYISFAGNVTFKKATILHRSCQRVPLDRLVLETDAPYLSPMPYRGKKNHPQMLSYTAQFVAEMKKVSLTELSQATCKNAVDLFNLDLYLGSDDLR